MPAETIPNGGMFELPKSGMMNEESSLPLMVHPVMVVPTPFLSASDTLTPCPPWAGLGVMERTTCDPVARDATLTVADPVEAR